MNNSSKGKLDPAAAAQKALVAGIQQCRDEKATGSVTVEVYIKDGVPNGNPKLIVSRSVK